MGHHGNSFLSFGAAVGAVGGWVELARTTLGVDNATISVTGIPDKRYYKVLLSSLGRDSGASANSNIQFNADTGSSYAFRQSTNGATDGTSTSTSNITMFGTGTTPSYYVGYLANLSGEEKLWQSNLCHQNTAGAGNSPFRQEKVGKWVDTSEPFDQINWNTGGAEKWLTGSEVVVLGWDPSDTHTTNFWEELFSEQLVADNGSFSTGTITAKKYLWLQFYQVGHTGNSTLTFNSDTTTSYSKRSSANGGTDGTVTSASNLINVLTAGTADPASFSNVFIVNSSANEKLMIIHTMSQNTAGATNAPFRAEIVAKWDDVAAQITSMQVDDSGAGFDTGSFLKIWGAN